MKTRAPRIEMVRQKRVTNPEIWLSALRASPRVPESVKSMNVNEKGFSPPTFSGNRLKELNVPIHPAIMTYSTIKAKANQANWVECPCDIALSKFCVSFDLNKILPLLLLLPIGNQNHLIINIKSSKRENTEIKSDKIVFRS